MRRLRLPFPAVAAFAISAGLAGPATASAQQIDTLALRAHTYFLAHDRLEGRDTGSEGERLAALYIVSQLRRIGLQGAGPDGDYLQPVPLYSATIDQAATTLTLRRAGQAAEFRYGEHFVLNTGGARALRDFSGNALFAGTGGLAHAALADHPSLDGQVIVILGSLGAEADRLIPDWIRRGAEGVVYLVPDPGAFRRVAEALAETPRLYVDADVDDPVWQPDLPILVAGPDLSAALLADAPVPPDALDGSRPFAAVSLEREVQARIRFEARALDAANVAAILPGKDPDLRHEVVAFTAHYDHLGIGPAVDGDSIYNGFSDNAAGTAMLLAIAEALAHEPPARSVLFLFFTGEERGLLGSSYYATSPLIPLERTVAVINLDAGAPPAPPRTWRVAGGTDSPLGQIAAAVAAEHGWEATTSEARPNSDYWPFLRRGVPAVFLIPGRDWEGVDRTEQERLHRRWDRYHHPADHWAADFPFSGLRRYAEFALALGRHVANRPEPPGRP